MTGREFFNAQEEYRKKIGDKVFFPLDREMDHKRNNYKTEEEYQKAWLESAEEYEKAIEDAGGLGKIQEVNENVKNIVKKMYDVVNDENIKDYYDKRANLAPLYKELYDLARREYKTDKSYVYDEDSFSLDSFGIYPHEDEISIEKIDNPKTPEDILTNIVRQTRSEKCGKDGKFSYMKCMDAQKRITQLCTEQNIENIPVDTQDTFKIPANQHAFSFINIGGKNYILDCTYSQFCHLSNSKERIGVAGRIPPKPGEFLMQTQEDRDLLKKLIVNGYIEATPENVKKYMDSFVMSNRNASFYLKYPDIDFFKTEFTPQDYLDAIAGKKELNIECDKTQKPLSQEEKLKVEEALKLEREKEQKTEEKRKFNKNSKKALVEEIDNNRNVLKREEERNKILLKQEKEFYQKMKEIIEQRTEQGKNDKEFEKIGGKI